MEGWLMKSGDTFVHAVSWKKRWFVLNEKELKLLYYTQPSDTQSLGAIDLKAVSQVTFSNEFNGKEKNDYGFEIHTPSRIYVMIADTQDEMVAWYNTLRRLLKLDLEEQSEDWMKDLSLALRGVLIKIRNDSDSKLLRVAFELDGKNQVFRVLPPECIEPHSIGSFGTQSQHGMVGTAGFVEYSFVGSHGIVKLGWQNPLSTIIYKKTAKYECNNPNFSVQSYVRDLNSKRNSLKGKGDFCEVEFIIKSNETPNITINTEPPSKEEKRKNLLDMFSKDPEPQPSNNNNNSNSPVVEQSPNLFRKSVSVKPLPEPQTIGKIHDRTEEFAEMRKGMKKNIDKECEKIMNRLSMVTFEINSMPPNNSWNFMKTKTVVPSSVVLQDLDDVSVCHVDKYGVISQVLTDRYQFKKKAEKFNCGLCGKVTCSKCLLPMKIGEGGRYEVSTCKTCTYLVNRKKTITEFKVVVERARDHPLASLYSDVKLMMEEITDSIPQYGQAEGKKRQMLEKKIDGLFNDVHGAINKLNQFNYASEREKKIGINLKTAWTQFLQENLIPYKALKK